MPVSIKKMITVTAAIIINSGKILITRRAPGKHLSGYWEFPGGKIDNGETDEECLAREIEEELDIKVEVGDFFMENNHHYKEKHIVLKAYFCRHLSGDILLHDHDQMAWVSPSDLCKYNFAPADIPFVKALPILHPSGLDNRKTY
ncbi:8-oxo-dGTP diphosphatase MutT [Saccharicrinis sp. GN24d3]|uniref:8-oxo-dGTP diphosphatase MutT n=1 Tax=Saccharicrinis sp. GN24d3 TaxID=3458416 RepID=UPI0040361D65